MRFVFVNILSLILYYHVIPIRIPLTSDLMMLLSNIQIPLTSDLMMLPSNIQIPPTSDLMMPLSRRLLINFSFVVAPENHAIFFSLEALNIQESDTDGVASTIGSKNGWCGNVTITTSLILSCHLAYDYWLFNIINFAPFAMIMYPPAEICLWEEHRTINGKESNFKFAPY
jgi:hypothetical protein